MLYYNDYVGNFPDEPAQVSYIAYLQCHNSIIPDFKNMTILTLNSNPNITSNTFNERNNYDGVLTFGTAFNYLCHPPLYYQIMRLAGAFHMTGNDTVTIDLLRLRCFSMGIALLAMLLVMYIGWSRLGNNPFIHMLYAVICISVPMLAYDCAGINNDTLSLLGVTVFTLGLIRFSEKKRNTCTYILIGSGLFVAFLSKLTAGIVVALSLGLFFVYTLIKEKNVKFVLSREFLVSVPFYILTIVYYIIVKVQTGSFLPNYQLLAPAQFYASPHYTPVKIGTICLHKFFTSFFSSFLYSWTGICSHVLLIKRDHFCGVNSIGLIIIIFLPLFMYLRSKRKNNPALPVTGIICPAIAATVILQFWDQYKEFLKTGYTGGFQSRYYLCAIAAIGLGNAFAMIKLYGPKHLEKALDVNESSLTGTHNSVKTPVSSASLNPKAATILKIRHAAVDTFCVGLSVLLIYEDFIYFVLNFHDYLK